MARHQKRTSNVRTQNAQEIREQNLNEARGISGVSTSSKIERPGIRQHKTVAETHLVRGAQKRTEQASSTQQSTQVQQHQSAEITKSIERAVAQQQKILRKIQQQQAHTTRTGKKKNPRIEKAKHWVAGTVAGTAYSFQFNFSITALTTLGAGAFIESTDSVLLDGVLGVTNFLGLTDISPETLYISALSLFGLSALISFGVCVVITALYYKEITRDTPSLLIAMTIFSLSSMPVISLFPWIPVWVWYLIAKSRISTLTGKNS